MQEINSWAKMINWLPSAAWWEKKTKIWIFLLHYPRDPILCLGDYLIGLLNSQLVSFYLWLLLPGLIEDIHTHTRETISCSLMDSLKCYTRKICSLLEFFAWSSLHWKIELVLWGCREVESCPRGSLEWYKWVYDEIICFELLKFRNFLKVVPQVFMTNISMNRKKYQQRFPWNFKLLTYLLPEIKLGIYHR